MPMPTPHENEEKDDFIDRCMGDNMMNEDYEDPAQRRAICESQWDDDQEGNKASRFGGITEAIRQYPWAILPATLEMIISAARAGNREAILAQGREGDARSEGFVAVLPLTGVISQRASLFQAMFGGTATERWGRMFAQFMGDPQVRAVVIDTDSPGGMVYGVPELAKKIFEARGTKPIIAIANSLMASGAYWIASAADEIVVSPGAEIGSIGVLAVHADISRALDKVGITMSVMSAGKHKAEETEFAPLTDEARQAIQGRVDRYYQMFTKAVAQHRGVSATAVRGGFGEGRVVGAEEAVSLGMADRVGTLDQTLVRLAGKYRASSPKVSTVNREIEIFELDKAGIV